MKGIILISDVNYFDVKKGNRVVVTEFVEAPKGSCSIYKVYNKGDAARKIHYLFTHEVQLT